MPNPLKDHQTPPISTTASNAAGRVDLVAGSVALAGCPPGWQRGSWELAGCAGVELGLLRAEGAGFVSDRQNREILVDVTVGGRIFRRLGRSVFVVAGVDLGVALRRPRFVYQDAAGDFQPLYRPHLVGATARLGLGVRFP